MICLKNIEDDHIYRIAEAFADSFLSEEGLISWSLDHDDAVEYFHLNLKEYAKLGWLYTTSEKEEGYIVFHRKKEKMPWYREFVMIYLYFKHISTEGLQKLAIVRNGWQDYPFYFSGEKDYVDVCLVCIKREYQHQGFMKKLLEEPKRIADENHIKMVLDTDSETKMEKYRHEGLQVVKDAVMKSGIHMYTMMYEPQQ